MFALGVLSMARPSCREVLETYGRTGSAATCCRVAPTRDGPGLPLTHNPGPDTSRRRNGLVLQADRPYRGWFRAGFAWRNTWSEPHGAEGPDVKRAKTAFVIITVALATILMTAA